MRKRLTGLLLISGLCMSIICGCTSENEKTEENEQVEETTPEESLKVIGTEAEGDNIYKVVLENNTSKDIVALSIKDSSMDAYPESMLASDDPFVQGEKRELYYDSTVAQEASDNQEGDASDPLVTPQYDVQLTFDDQTVMILTAFPFDDMEEGQICLEDGVAFLSYKVKSALPAFDCHPPPV